MILTAALWFALACFSLALMFNIWRLVAGPDIADRLLAVDTMVIDMIALILLYSMITETSLYFEAAMLFALTGFVSTVAFAKFLLRGDIVE